MRIHQVDCGTMRAPGGPIPSRILLVEAPGGLVLVDSGLGTADLVEPRARLGPLRHLLRPVRDPDRTALHRVRALGADPGDVRHIVLTHLDADHAGGLSDFPRAEVHVSATALTWASRTPRWIERTRYRRVQWAHGPRFREYHHDSGRWEGFRVAALDHVAPGMAMVDLPGHVPGHSGVLVPGDDGGRDLLHAGDAFYHRGQIRAPGRDGPAVRVPRHVPAMEAAFALEGDAVALTHSRLATLAARRPHDLHVVCSHDPSGPGGIGS